MTRKNPSSSSENTATRRSAAGLSRHRRNGLSQTYGPRRLHYLTQVAEREGISLAKADQLHPHAAHEAGENKQGPLP